MHFPSAASIGWCIDYADFVVFAEIIAAVACEGMCGITAHNNCCAGTSSFGVHLKALEPTQFAPCRVPSTSLVPTYYTKIQWALQEPIIAVTMYSCVLHSQKPQLTRVCCNTHSLSRARPTSESQSPAWLPAINNILVRHKAKKRRCHTDVQGASV